MVNVIVLGTAQFFGAFGQVTMVVLAGIIGAMLAPDPRLATLPVSCSVIGVAAATIPAALAAPRFGRRRVFMAGALIAAAGTLLAAAAISAGSFWLYCLATPLIGCNLAFTSQFRFAAAESVAPGQVSRAVAWVMLGTVAAAGIAPRLVVAVRHWLGAEYVASMLLLGTVYLVSALVLTRLRPVGGHEQPGASGPARPLGGILRQPGFVMAVLASTVGYGVMALVMTAAPLSMHVADGHSVEATALVIQGHVLAMYAPSLFSGWLVERLGVVRMLVAGAACEAACVATAISGHDIPHYGLAMVLLGVGWNLLFVAGTTLLTRSYRPADRFRAQAFNDFCMFAVMATASLAAGVLINGVGWRALNLIALLPLLVVLALAVLLARQPAAARAA